MQVVCKEENDLRALLSYETGGPTTLRMGEIDDPVPAAGEVVIQIAVCAVNFPDSLIIEDRYQFYPARPFAPGGEVAGTIAAVGEGVEGLAVGDRVMAMCKWGGMAERVSVAAQRCYVMPDAMPFEHGAALLLTFGTAIHALKQRAALAAGERLLVLGASGGVGLAAVSLGRAMGAHVVAAASSEDKLAAAMEAGAQTGFVYPGGDLDQKELNALFKEECGPVDVVLDPVGGMFAEASVRSLAWNGRYLVVGFPAGIPQLATNLLLLKGAAAIGVFYGTFTQKEPELELENVAELLAFYNAGKIAPLISGRYPLAQGGAAIAELAERRVLGKVVVEIGG